MQVHWRTPLQKLDELEKCMNDWLSKEKNRWFEPSTSVTLQNIKYMRHLEITIGIPHNGCVLCVDRICQVSTIFCTGIGKTGAFVWRVRPPSTQLSHTIADNWESSRMRHRCPSRMSTQIPKRSRRTLERTNSWMSAGISRTFSLRHRRPLRSHSNRRRTTDRVPSGSNRHQTARRLVSALASQRVGKLACVRSAPMDRLFDTALAVLHECLLLILLVHAAYTCISRRS